MDIDAVALYVSDSNDADEIRFRIGAKLCQILAQDSKKESILKYLHRLRNRVEDGPRRSDVVLGCLEEFRADFELNGNP